MRPEDAPSFRDIRFPDGRLGWPGYTACLDAGLRCFGVLSGDRIVALAGFQRLTRNRSEIVGVATYRAVDRRRGMGGAACRAALAAALAQTPVATWTSETGNEASLATARSLGMQIYHTTYQVVMEPTAPPGERALPRTEPGR